ncbi:hypothetical protein GCM10012320_07760 [Sinomonas cellulolyticus]|nr:hypothetical protein GCM10012320_07760 [Sinomonas sp. KCTC 49339]
MAGGNGSGEDLDIKAAPQEAVQEGRLRRYLRQLGPGLVTGQPTMILPESRPMHRQERASATACCGRRR